jgi:hypothetical protein
MAGHAGTVEAVERASRQVVIELGPVGEESGLEIVEHRFRAHAGAKWQSASHRGICGECEPNFLRRFQTGLRNLGAHGSTRKVR